MRRRIVLTITCLLIGGSAVLGAGDQGKSKKHKDAAYDAAAPPDGSAAAVRVSWRQHDVEVVRRYYEPKYRSLPPGLQKKYALTGQLPPGWQKKMQPLPASLEHECAPLPAGYHRGVIDAHAVIYDRRGMIADVVILY